jgi:hypothetical protein
MIVSRALTGNVRNAYLCELLRMSNSVVPVVMVVSDELAWDL